MTTTISLVATSRADENSYASLADVTGILGDASYRVIGGHMVSILSAAFPTAAPIRRTSDSDVGVDVVELAAVGLDDQLRNLGYKSTSGNHYERAAQSEGKLAIDVLVPSPTAVFEPLSIGDRTYDAAPGLRLALAAPSLDFSVVAHMLDGKLFEFRAKLPTVEHALIIKASAFQSRLETRDLEDIYGLLEIASEYDREAIGGWRLDAPPLRGSRLDAARVLINIARTHRTSGVVQTAAVPGARLAALINLLIRDE